MLVAVGCWEGTRWACRRGRWRYEAGRFGSRRTPESTCTSWVSNDRVTVEMLYSRGEDFVWLRNSWVDDDDDAQAQLWGVRPSGASAHLRARGGRTCTEMWRTAPANTPRHCLHTRRHSATSLRGRCAATTWGLVKEGTLLGPHEAVWAARAMGAWGAAYAPYDGFAYLSAQRHTPVYPTWCTRTE